MAVTQEEILIAAPIWLAQDDSQAGAGQSSDLYFSDGGWSVGSKSKGPGKADISSYTVMDDLIKRFANQEEFPALTSVTVAGHSLGASFSQRYAMVRNDDASTDSLLRFWIGNPGAYVWPSPDRPVTPSNTSCASEVDEWAYGVSRSLPAYVKGVKNNVSAVYERYRSRVIQYALGMDDDGPGDTHCEAQYQGSSHLERGQNLQKALEAMEGGMPASQTFNYVPNTSHQDYLMMSDPNSQDFLFVADLDAQRSTATQAGNTSTGKKTATNGNSSGAGIPEIPTTIFVLIGLSSVFMFLFH